MDDIFLDDPRQTSAQKLARNPKNKKAPRRRFRQYLADLIIKSLLLAALLALDFTLFAEAGSYSLFSPDQILTPEATWIYAAIAVASFFIIFLCSFSLTLQNFMIGTGAAALLLAIFNQFAQFDQSAVLAAYFGTARTGASSDIFSSCSHWVLAGALLLAVLIFLTFARRMTQVYLLCCLLLIVGALISEAYFNPVTRTFDDKLGLNDESTHTDSYNFVFIGLINAPSYHKLMSMSEESKNEGIKQAADNMLGFYQQNNFVYYPYAYTRHRNQPFLNLVDSLNPQPAKQPQDVLLSDVLVNGYWNFKKLDSDRIYLRENQVFEKFHKDDYNLRIYQSHAIELCDLNNRRFANRCIEKINNPINFSGLDLSLPQKTALLAAQWLESTGLVSSINPILSIASVFHNDISLFHFSTAELYEINSFKMLDRMAEDIANDRGNNAYFTVLDMPGNIFIYDSLCNIKPVSRWVSADDTSTPLNIRKAALAEQTSCLYGQLENFVQKLRNNDSLKQTTLVIQSLNTPFPTAPGIEKELFKSLAATRQTGLAIYNPLTAEADINYQICTTPAILDSHLFKTSCPELEDFTITEQLKDEMFKQADEQKLTNDRAANAVKTFQNWYTTWAAQNQQENKMNEEIIPLEKVTSAPADTEVSAAPTVAETKELPPEAPTQALPKTPEPPVTTEEKQPKAEVQLQSEDKKPALSKPEELKKKFLTTPSSAPEKTETGNVNIEVKVIDQTEGSDVIPPFLKEQPATASE